MGLLLDFRYAIRNIIKSIKFTLLVLFIIVGSLTISLIGFNYIHTIAFSHSNFADSQKDIRIIDIRNSLSSQRAFSFEMLKPFSEIDQVKKIEKWLAIQRTQFWLSDGLRSDHYRGSYVMPSFFEFLGQEPVIGRGFIEDDFSGSAPNVVVISHIIWQKFFQSDPGVIGQSINIEGVPYEVVGVMEKRNHFPIFSKLWVPLKTSKLKPDDSIEILYKTPGAEFEKDLERALSHFFRTYIEVGLSKTDKEQGDVLIDSLTLVEKNTDGEAVFLFTLFVVGILLVIFIASVNIGNLLYARILEKQKESAIRAAIGASKKRVIQQNICEGVIFCLVSWIFSLLFTSIGLDILNFYMNSMFDGMPYWWHWQLNSITIMVSTILLGLIFVFAVLIPAFKTANFNISNVLRDGTRGATGKNETLLSKRLLCIQVSLVSFVLMVTSAIGYVMITYAGNIDEDLVTGLFTANFSIENESLTKDEQLSVINTLTQSLKNKESIEDIYTYRTRYLVMNVEQQNGEFYQDKPISFDAQSNVFERSMMHGRNFSEIDNLQSKPVVIISESLAIELFGQSNAVGNMLKLDGGDWPSAEIIGITHDIITGITGDNRHEVYLSLRQLLMDDELISVDFISRSAKSESLEDIYEVIHKLDIDIELGYVFDHHDNHLSMLNAFSAIIYVFILVGGFAMTLSLIGIYAMGLSNVNNARYEIGIRRAIGAKDKQILFLFIHKNIKHILFGVCIALMIYYTLCYLAVDFLRNNVPFSIMFGSGTVTVILVLMAVCLALYVPVKSAIKQQPAISLRMD